MERKSNLTLPSYVWVGGEMAKWPNAAEGETVAAFLCLFGMSDPPPTENLFFVEGVFFVGGGVHWEGSVAEAAQGGRGILKVGGYDPPPSVLDATAEWVRQCAPKGGRPGKQTKRGPEVVVVQADAPPPHRGKGPTPSPKPSPKLSKVAKVAAQPPPEALGVEALGASVATLVTVLVEQAAATGVEAALAKGRSADHKSALAKAEKVQGNTQRALDHALNLAAKRGPGGPEEVEAMRGALREAEDGRRKAEGGGGGGPAA